PGLPRLRLAPLGLRSWLPALVRVRGRGVRGAGLATPPPPPHPPSWRRSRRHGSTRHGLGGGPVRVLVVNAGSSSLKLRVLDGSDRVTGTADLPAPRGAADAAAVGPALASLGDADARGHRIVHGGPPFPRPVPLHPAR